MGILRRDKDRNQGREIAGGGEPRGQGTAMTRQESGSQLSGSPFTFMRRMFDDVERMFESFGIGGMSAFGQEPHGMTRLWAPRIDVVQRDHRLLVHADLPGMDVDDVDIDLIGDQLVITGERQDEHEQHEADVWRRERVYGSFQRAIPLPRGVDPDRIEARFQNGVLEISIELPEEQRRRRVQIGSGGGRREPQVQAGDGGSTQPQVQTPSGQSNAPSTEASQQQPRH
jgi:HSP20 family protein